MFGDLSGLSNSDFFDSSDFGHFGSSYPKNQRNFDYAAPSVGRNQNNTKPTESSIEKIANDTERTDSCIGKRGFQVNMDVQHYKPEAISVKAINNSVVIIDGKHEERQDQHGFIKRQFTRRYQLPKGLHSDDVVSSLSSDGILTVKAPASENCMGSSTRQIQIQQTGPSRSNNKY